MNESKTPLTADECRKNFRYTRDFELYLDMLNILKSKYLIIFCIKNTAGQNISEAAIEKIHSLGFSEFTAEPDMKYIGIYGNGSAVRNSSSKADEDPLELEINISKTNFYISFKEKEVEIKINGMEQSLRDKGLNIVVYDLKKSETADACCYNASEGKPTFYHRNFYYDEQYIDTHVYMPKSFKAKVSLPMRRSYFSSRELGVREIERGIFLPTKCVVKLVKGGFKSYGGICDENLRFVAGHQVFNTSNTGLDERHISDSYEDPPEDITYIDETVLYGGSMPEHPGHLIIESFADRLWWLVENPDSDVKIAVEKIWGDRGWASDSLSFVGELLEAFGIANERIIFIDKPTQFKKIIIPDQSSIPLYYCFPYDFTSEFIKPFQYITKQLAPGKYKKIYFTKSKTGKRNIGEEYFIEFFKKKGFQIIHPEDHTMREKAELMYGAEEVVTVDGTSSLFTIFCKPTVRLTILARRMDFWDIPQQLINEAVGIKEFFLVNVSGNFLDSFSDNEFMNYATGMTFTYATREFKRYVKYVYNEKIDITPEESLKKYLWDYLAYFPVYYSDKLPFPFIKNVKMTHILQGMSEVFLGKELDTGDLDISTDDELRVKSLVRQLQNEKQSSAEKIQALTEKAKEILDENASLKQTISGLEAEIRQLRSEKAELSSYMAEISTLLDALEAQGGLPSEQ